MSPKGSKFRNFSFETVADFPASINIERGESQEEIIDAFVRKVMRVHGKTTPTYSGFSTLLLDLPDGFTVRISNLGTQSGNLPLNVTSPPPPNSELNPVPDKDLAVSFEDFNVFVEKYEQRISELEKMVAELRKKG